MYLIPWKWSIKMQRWWLFHRGKEFAYTSCRNPWRVVQKLNHTHSSDNGLVLYCKRIFNQLEQMLGGNFILEATLQYWQVHKRVSAAEQRWKIRWKYYFFLMTMKSNYFLMGSCSHFCSWCQLELFLCYPKICCEEGTAEEPLTWCGVRHSHSQGVLYPLRGWKGTSNINIWEG